VDRPALKLLCKRHGACLCFYYWADSDAWEKVEWLRSFHQQKYGCNSKVVLVEYPNYKDGE
jgi:hypothetical protein